MELRDTKIISSIIILVLSVVFSYLPLLLAIKCGTKFTASNKGKKRKKDRLMAFMLNFGGGVLVANVFCHWMPELKEGIDDLELHFRLPIAEIVVCSGLLGICFLEECIHFLLRVKSPTVTKTTKGGSANFTLSTRPRPSKNGEPFSTEHEFCSHTEGFCDNKSLVNDGNVFQGSLDKVPIATATTTTSRIVLRVKKPGYNSGDSDHVIQDVEACARDMGAEGNLKEDSEEEEEEKTVSLVRVFFIVCSLSFHSVLEGMALGLGEDEAGVWTNLAAISLHKGVIAFSVGVELLSVEASRMHYLISATVFALAPALGTTIAIILTEYNNHGTEIGDLPLLVLQGLASGTVIYVVFFEVFPKAKVFDRAGFQHVIAMVLGFLVFLPSLLLHAPKSKSNHGSHLDDVTNGGT